MMAYLIVFALSLGDSPGHFVVTDVINNIIQLYNPTGKSLAIEK